MALEIFFTLTAFIGIILLLIHCYTKKQPYEVILFFGIGFIFGILRENLIQFFIEQGFLPALYSYSINFIRILYSPIVIGFGWVFAFYNGMIVGEKVLSSSESLKISLISSIFVMLISIPIEITAVAMNWWEWTIPGMPLFLGMPLMVPFGWGTAAFIFLFSYKLVDQRIKLIRNKVLIFLGLIIPLIGIHFIIVILLRMSFVAIGTLSFFT